MQCPTPSKNPKGIGHHSFVDLPKFRYLDPDGIQIGTLDRRVNHFGAGFGVAKLQTCQIVQKRGDGLIMNW